MIWKLNSLIGEIEDKTKTKYSLKRISREVNISYPTLHRISHNTAKQVSHKTLEKLLVYLSEKLSRQLTVNDLLERDK